MVGRASAGSAYALCGIRWDLMSGDAFSLPSIPVYRDEKKVRNILELAIKLSTLDRSSVWSVYTVERLGLTGHASFHRLASCHPPFLIRA